MNTTPPPPTTLPDDYQLPPKITRDVFLKASQRWALGNDSRDIADGMNMAVTSFESFRLKHKTYFPLREAKKWTNSMSTQCKDLIQQGYSASEAASMLQSPQRPLSTNAVIGHMDKKYGGITALRPPLTRARPAQQRPKQPLSPLRSTSDGRDNT